MSAEITPPPGPSGPTSSSQFGRAALAILATMLLLIVALTGILVETTVSQPAGAIEAPPGDPGSFAHR